MVKETGPNMEVRALLAVVLSLLVLTLYQSYFLPPPDLADVPAEVAAAGESGTGDDPLPALEAEVSPAARGAVHCRGT